MIDQVLAAFVKETLALFEGTETQVVTEANVLGTNNYTHGGNLVLIDYEAGEPTGQFFGGVTYMYYTIHFNTYNWMPDNYNAEVDYSVSLIGLIDQVRQHFTMRQWLVQEMKDIWEQLGHKFELSGIGAAKQLDRDDLTYGNNIQLALNWLDRSTRQWNYTPIPSDSAPVISIGQS